MFERFTDTARRVLVLAQEEARTLGHSFIFREHLLLAVMDEAEAHPDSVSSAIFAAGGAPADALRGVITQAASQRDAQARSRDPEAANPKSQPFSAAAKKTLELSLREALQLGHNYIADFHLLLAMVRSAEKDGPSEFSTLIVNAGLDGERARALALRLAPAQSDVGTTGTQRTRSIRGRGRGTPGFEAVLVRASKGDSPPSTADLLLALLDEPDTHAWMVFTTLEVPEREKIQQLLDVLRETAVPDGAVRPMATVDPSSGAITINDPRITALMKTPPEEQSQEDHDKLADLVAQAIVQARERMKDTDDNDE